jgi:predicted TIM-barrel fold metal-dependent hydrolase
LRIDVFTHIIPRKYNDTAAKVAPEAIRQLNAQARYTIPPLSDLDARFRIMDKYDGLMHVLTLSLLLPLADLSKSIDLVKLGNDELAELVLKYPDRFPAAVANLPMQDMDAALKEVDRAINDLKLRGVQITTPINDKPLDSPEFMPPHDRTGGDRMTRLTIGAVEEMDISDADRKKIYEDNVRSLLRLPV